MNSIQSGNGDYIHLKSEDIRRVFDALDTENVNPFSQRTIEDILKKMGFPIEIWPNGASYKLSLAYIASHISLEEELNILDHAVIAALVSLLVRKYTDLKTFDNLSETAITLHNITSAAISSGNLTPGDINFMDFNRYTVENIWGIH